MCLRLTMASKIENTLYAKGNPIYLFTGSTRKYDSNESRFSNDTDISTELLANDSQNYNETESRLQFFSADGPTPGPLLYAIEWLLAHAILLGDNLI